MRTLQRIGSFLLVTAMATWAYGEAPTTGAAASASTAPTAQNDGEMKVYITDVSGLVQVRGDESQPWQTAKVHMVVQHGAELRTGPHSSVTCVIPPDQTFTLDRLGTVRVEEAARHGDKITTDLIMKYGRTHYDIEAAGLEHEGSIVSPSSTLAIRGTNVSLYDQPPYTPEATSYTGRANFTYGLATVPIGQRNGSVASVMAGDAGASQTAVNETVVDPHYGPSQTASDQALISTEVSRGAVLAYSPNSNIQVISGGRPSYDSELPSTLPGTLDFVLRWTGNADLNIEVGVDKGNAATAIAAGFQTDEFLYPGYGYQTSASGGRIAYDDVGGPTGGEEIVYWKGAFPTGLYGIAAQSISGATTSFTFNVFANGVPLQMFYFTPDFTFVKSTQETSTLANGQFSTAIVPVPDLPALDEAVSDDPAGNPNPGITPGSFSSTSQSTASKHKATKPTISLARNVPASHR